MTVSTPHMLNNLARGENCGWPTQMHFDGAFNFCDEDVSVLGIGLNSMGAHYNPVSISLAISAIVMSVVSVHR